MRASKRRQMTGSIGQRYDLAVVGAGPVGTYCALVHARKGARVALLEANPKASRRLAGEWLHPPAVDMLRDAGVHLEGHPRSTAGRGFAVFPEDGSEPILLPYPDGSRGLSCEHRVIVSKLREAVENQPGVDFMPLARVRGVEDGAITYHHEGTDRSLSARRIVGADGRASVVRRSLGLSTNWLTCSRMLGVLVEGVSLPLAGYGHVILGAPGHMLMYGLGEHDVRVIVDVPMDLRKPRDRIGLLVDSYAPFLPEAFLPAFLDALLSGRFDAATNEVRPRVSYGTSHRILIGDAAGHYHPMTAVGLTLGFRDATALAEGGELRDVTERRLESTRAPELLAMGLYEIFADHRAEAVALRQAVYRGWRASAAVRSRTMRLLGCEDTSTTRLGLTLLVLLARAVLGEIPRSWNPLAWRRIRDIVHRLVGRLFWFLRGARQLGDAKSVAGERNHSPYETEERNRGTLARALLVSMPSRQSEATPERPREPGTLDAGPALARASARLVGQQGDDGAWEGELVWCPMLTAQYVLVQHITERPIDSGRRRRVLRYFERTRFEGGTWGFHEHSEPHLFVTTLVYVAARLLGVERDDPLVEPARAFLREEGVTRIPRWGKFWLALLNLYGWQGVTPVLPELWALPRWVPLHPSNWYCHSRLVYMAMAATYPRRYRLPVTPLIESLREELYPGGFANVDFAASRNRLRDADLFVRPTVWLRGAYALMGLFERFHSKGLRDRCVATLIRHIKSELRGSSHASLSPINGLLNILALWLHDREGEDLRRALAEQRRWIWEDDALGTRLAVQRTATWDTGFALQALAAMPRVTDVRNALRHGADYLRRHQLGPGCDGFSDAYRSDPKGGWCLGRAWQGWPVSDCTAEAVLGVIAGCGEATDDTMLAEAIRFILTCQNRDGGFGSYEARRGLVGLEWLNPSEIFADAMNERSYVECTASSLAALAACGERCPRVTDGVVAKAIARGVAWLRRTQSSDGSWPGTWGVNFIYGTLFGIRGLVAGGARPGDPAMRVACAWLLGRQREDGGWGEHHSGCLSGRYVPHDESQVIQTAWALMALLEAGDPDWTAITRGVGFLLEAQTADGSWPRQDVAGVYARSGLLDYPLYRQYFPLHALGLYERRRRARSTLSSVTAHASDALG